MPRYARLADDWLLRGWSDLPRAAVNWKSGELRPLDADGLYVLRACDGTTDLESPAFLPGHVCLLDTLMADGLVEEGAHGDPHPVAADARGRQAYRRAPNRMLLEIHWAVSGRCNLACRHCFMEAGDGRYGELPFDAMRRLIGQFAAACVPAVSITGGEPLLRPDFFAILEELAARRIRVPEIVTNGMLVTDAFLDRLRTSGHRPRFKISFDGCGAHDAMRGVPGSEAVVLEAIRRVAASGFDLAVSTTVDALNLDSLELTYERLARLRVPVWLVGRTQTIGNERGSARQVPTAIMAARCLRLLKVWLQSGRPMGIVLERFFSGGPLAPVGRGWHDVPSVRAPYTAESDECGACRLRPFLLPDGTLLPCQGFTGTALAAAMPNLFEQDLSTACTHPALRVFAEMKKRSVLEHNDECAACGEFERCGGGCRAYALTEGGNVMARDPRACDLWVGRYPAQFAAVAAGAADTPTPITHDPALERER